MTRLITTLWIGVLMSGTAWSQLPMDSDGDGAVSLSELQAVRSEVTAERFSRMDANGDGMLTTDELGSRGRRGGNGRFNAGEIDGDGDGAVSFEELQAVRPEVTEDQFARMDTNADGVISEDERRERRGGGSRDRQGDRQGDREDRHRGEETL